MLGKTVRRWALISACTAGSFATSAPAFATNPHEYTPDGLPVATIATAFPDNGDPFGTRKWLADRGITFNLLYRNDVLANVAGGLRRGVINQGLLETSVYVDFGKLAGWQGLGGFINTFAIHNTGRMRRDFVGGINTIAAIEAVPTVRLSEAWLEQRFFDGRASLRFGQLAADVEFFFAGSSALFLQNDWATITSAALPSGGPAYPLATPGFRLKLDPSPLMSLLVAVFNGDPAGPGAGDEQLRNRYGLNFRVRDPAFIIAEAQFRRNRGAEDTGLSTGLKIGAWTHLGRFDHMRLANDGLSLANPMSSGMPLRLRGNAGVYAVFEQQLYRLPGGDGDSGIKVDSRISFSPTDRNLISLFGDISVTFSGMVRGRPDDRFGASLTVARFSDAVRALDRDRILLSGIPGVVRDFEANLELTYQAQVRPGFTIQPLVTYVWHPNGDRRRNALVGGVRTGIRF